MRASNMRQFIDNVAKSAEWRMYTVLFW